MTTKTVREYVKDLLVAYDFDSDTYEDLEIKAVTWGAADVTITYVDDAGEILTLTLLDKDRNMGVTTTAVEPETQPKRTLRSIVESQEQRDLVEAVDPGELMSLYSLFAISEYADTKTMSHPEKVNTKWVAMMLAYLTGAMDWVASLDMLTNYERKLGASDLSKLNRAYMVSGPTVKAAMEPILVFFKETLYGVDGQSNRSSSNNAISQEIKYG